MHEQEAKIINVPVSRELYRKLFQRRVETGIPVYRLSEAIFKFGSFLLDGFDLATSWQISDDADTLLHGKIFREKLAKKRFPELDLKQLDAVIMRAEAFLAGQREKGGKGENENGSDA